MPGEKNKMALELWEKLSKAYDKVKRVQSKQMFENKLTAPQFGVLDILNRIGSVPLKKISEEMMVTGANITCVVDNLEKEGFVRRVSSKEDRRVILAELTSQGKNKIDSLMPAYVENISSVASGLTENEQKELTKLLAKLHS